VGERGVVVASRGDAPEGSLRRVSIALGVAVLLACALPGALFAGVARADVPGLVSSGNFASVGGLGVAVDNSCSLHSPSLSGEACTAFDPSSGDVFATGFFYSSGTGFEVGSSEKFDASGKLLSPPSPFAVEGINYGAAVNPTNGDLYVASLFGEIDTYDPNTGALLSSFPVPPFFATELEAYGNLAQLATDSAGNVYVPNAPGNEVLEYSPTPTVVGGVAVPLQTFAGSGAHALSGPTGVAVDSSGDVWVADDGHNRIEEFGPSGVFLNEFASEGVRALALDAQGDVLAVVNNSADFCGAVEAPCAHLVEYSSTGVQLADVGAGDFGAVGRKTLPQPLTMVAVNEASGRVYVTDGEKSLVWVFQPPVAPVLSKEFAVEVGTGEAKLGALVNPGGAETSYRFEYDTREYREGEGSHGVSVPFPEGSVGQGLSSRTVWASASGLAPGTTYHYRVIVTNGLGTVVGTDQTFTTEIVAQASCPNEQLRGGFSAGLPDCRAYELVTPPNKESAQPDTKTAPMRGGADLAARDGNRMAYVSSEVLPGSQSAGLEYVATRGVSGWSSQDVVPLQSYTGDRCPFGEPVAAYSADLLNVVVGVGSLGFGECRENLVEVVKGEPLDTGNLLMRDNATGAYQLIDVTPPGVVPTGAGFVAVSADGSHVVFEEFAKLTPDALNNVVNMYEWSEGVVRLLTVLPEGARVSGASFAGISADGSDVLFTFGGDLYMRVNGERTVWVDQPQGGSGPGGGGSFRGVTANGSQVFFTADASAGLTSDTVAGSGTNLYRYDVETGQLSDLTPVGDAKASLDGISEDGSYVYFSAETALTGSQSNQFGETAQDGKANLYLDRDGTLTFIAHEGVGIAQLSPNGEFFVFDGQGGIDLYSAASNHISCASCNPSGQPGGASLGSGEPPGLFPHSVSNNGQVFFETTEALLPSDTNGQMDVYEYENGGLHLISTGTSSTESVLLDSSESGNDVFFLTRQKLLPQDTNEEALSIYDARVDGGFPETAIPPACTTADSCRSAPTPQPAIFGEPASQTFSGIGNLTSSEAKAKAKPRSKTARCRKGFVRKKGRCVKRPGRKAGKSAHANKRTGK
jgi:NHL repeat